MIEYHHPVMQDFTKDTYGVVIYQEQVMLTMTELAGMPMTTADKVRKIIGKKRDVSEFEAYKAQFVEGASEKVSKTLAESLWHDFEAHAGYSFNKSHAVAYSMLSYWTAWLKQYYPLEFMTAVLRNENDKDSMLDYLIETKRMGIRVMLPHVNASGIEFEIQSDENGDFIRMGLSNIKYISGKIGQRLLEQRPFRSYNELYEIVMTKGSGLSTRTLQALNAIGGAAFGDNPRTGNERDNFFEYLNIPAFQTQDLPPMMKAQFRPLDEFAADEAFVSMGMVRGIKTGPGWARVEIVDESGSAGVFAGEHTPIESGQMYVFLIANNRVARYISVADLVENKGDAFEEFLEAQSFPDIPEGMFKVVAFNSRTTKAGKRMAEAVFCNEQKELIPALIFPGQFMKAYSMCKEGAVVDVQFKETQDGTRFVENVL
jgi:DNA polymerase-3 subunit alpha